jgi:hypothetical protein
MIDITDAFLYADNKDYIILCMNGTLAELMAKTDPKMYRKSLTDKMGRRCYTYTSKKPSME